MQYMIKSLRCLCYLRILLNTYVINTFENFSFTVLIFFLVADQEQILATLSKAVQNYFGHIIWKRYPIGKVSQFIFDTERRWTIS